uniref:Uncharacterized protein n=1 Tax=Chenopodium quinoa TaxID=63459 RepID=A0A803MJ03_CHEQI
MSNEGDVSTSGKKKHKKRKNSEISDLGAEEGNVELADESRPKKKLKQKVLSDSGVDVDFGADMDKSLRKKKKKDVNGIDVDTLWDDNKSKGKMKKGKSGDRREASKVLESSGEAVNEENLEVSRSKRSRKKKNDRDNVDHKENSGIELVKGDFKMKKKSNDNVGDASFVEKQAHNEVIANKKQKNVKDSLGDRYLSEDHLGNSHVNAHKSVEDSQLGGNRAVNLDKELEMNTHCASTNGRQKFRDRGNKKRKEKSRGCYTEVDATDCMPEMNKAAEPSELSTHKKSKKVQFSETVEVFPLSDESIKEKKKMVEVGNEENNNVENGLVQGKRFSKEEDEMVRNAVYKYVEDHQLGEEGVEMVMNCRLHQELKGCWKEIGESLPWRPYLAVYSRAHVLFERSEDRKWTPEEVELVKKFYEKHGPDWKTLGDELGKHRFHVKDVWRRTRYPNLKKGTWSQEEYQNLFNLVNMDLSMKVFTEKRSKHGMLRDNIAWDAVSDQLATRSNSLCCMKWYDSLTSPMVAEGKWANSDDYRMLIALVDRDDACEDDVDWDNLLEHRSGDICRKRWNQMVRHIGEHGRKSFIEQVEILSQRYCPNILEARESYDNRPAVDA